MRLSGVDEWRGYGPEAICAAQQHHKLNSFVLAVVFALFIFNKKETSEPFDLFCFLILVSFLIID